MRKNLKLFVSVLMAFAILLSLAGVELTVQNPDGLKLTKWEKSAAIKNLNLSGPITYQKNDILKVGLFTKDNVLKPDANGQLDLG